MNRVTEYIRFTMCFMGAGYVALWPMTARDNAVTAWQAASLCGALPFDVFCRSMRGLPLSPGLHVLGTTALLFACVCLSARVIRRLRRYLPARARPVPSSAAEATPPRRSHPLPSPGPVKPRTHFGLRGQPP